ncbi:MAG: C40 family peptidase [Blautia sp.]|nr:C40 family peptidase [Blautia sp.]
MLKYLYAAKKKQTNENITKKPNTAAIILTACLVVASPVLGSEDFTSETPLSETIIVRFPSEEEAENPVFSSSQEDDSDEAVFPSQKEDNPDETLFTSPIEDNPDENDPDKAAFTSSEKDSKDTDDTTASDFTSSASGQDPKEEKEEKSLLKITGQDIADFALQFTGTPYVWGGSSLTSGVDCSGFVMKVFEAFGFSLPHYAESQSGYGTAVDYSELQPGDLIFYSYGYGITHVAISIGNHQAVHAWNSDTGVVVTADDVDPVCCCRRLI